MNGRRVKLVRIGSRTRDDGGGQLAQFPFREPIYGAAPSTVPQLRRPNSVQGLPGLGQVAPLVGKGGLEPGAQANAEQRDRRRRQPNVS